MGKEKSNSPETLSDETVKRWIKMCEEYNDEGLEYRRHICLALENNNPLAWEFLRKALEIDPVFVQFSPFRTILENSNSEEQGR